MHTSGNGGAVHGGTDALGVPAWDFSTNSNAAGPCPHTVEALAAADATRYPDPAYTQLREVLAALHGVAVQRIVIGASGSELIVRLTCWTALRNAGQAKVWTPLHAYGDYAHAAQQHGLQGTPGIASADLVWLCAPSSPLGQVLALPDGWKQRQPGATVVLDCAYAPLKLDSDDVAPGLDKNSTWQIWTPNKALGLCGIRAAYAIAPEHTDLQTVQSLAALAPSWPVGAHGVALLENWCTAQTRQWLDTSHTTLRQWKQQQTGMLHAHSWQILPSRTNFFVAQPDLPAGMPFADWLLRLRQHGIKLRDCASFGLPGHVRLCVHTPPAQTALNQALRSVRG
ncbi:MAG: aminotransferase class I/II-fold pyridoxal phosphate-dependent enzyme [Brachymonas sp.]|nr:aminotransferase class I/II-fold pyridoxal phosphate-dependent enzyme [Brachymonas sp.]